MGVVIVLCYMGVAIVFMLHGGCHSFMLHEGCHRFYVTSGLPYYSHVEIVFVGNKTKGPKHDSQQSAKATHA
jgi:hypothetical protein